MKSFIVAACIVACAYAVNVDKEAQVEQNEYELKPDGSYSQYYRSSNGLGGESSGTLVSVGKEEPALNVVGSYYYETPEGQKISLKYTADENGFHPEGDHLPTPPAPEPIPEYIARALAYIAANPYTENNKN